MCVCVCVYQVTSATIFAQIRVLYPRSKMNSYKAAIKIQTTNFKKWAKWLARPFSYEDRQKFNCDCLY